MFGQPNYSRRDQDCAPDLDLSSENSSDERGQIPAGWKAALDELDDDSETSTAPAELIAPTPNKAGVQARDQAPDQQAIKASDQIEQAEPMPNYRAMFHDAKVKKKLAKDRNRQQRHRARPQETSIVKLASSLRKAIAKSRGNKQLEQLGERVTKLASFRFFSRIIIAQHGPMSDADLARHMSQLDEPMKRKKVWQLRQIVADLEAEGGPWHDI